jgi:polar amino acid transport system substrate-binding protein
MCHRLRTRGAQVTIAAVLAAVGAGCGDSDSSGQSAAPAAAASGGGEVDAAARKLLPEAMASSGKLRVATMLDWPPFTYKDPDGKPTGIDIDMISAVAGTLGLEPVITNLADGGWIPGLQNGKFDVAVSQLAISPERAAVVGFVQYIGNPLGLMVRQADAAKIDPNDLCGHTLIGTQGTGPLSFGRKYSKDECVGKGKPAIKFQVYGDSGTTILSLANGRGEGFLVDKAVGAYTAETTNKNIVMDEGSVPGSITRSGIAFPKDQPQIGEAVKAALLAMQKNGAYERILAKWKISDEALPADEITMPASS